MNQQQQPPYEAYMSRLMEKIPGESVRAFIAKYPKMRTSAMFQGFSEDEVHLHAFVRVILDNKDVLEPFFREVIGLAPQERVGGDFRFTLPSHDKLCSQYYVSFSPLGVLFFLFAWMQEVRPNITQQYISKREFVCIKQHINACRNTPNVLVRATAILHDHPNMDICNAIQKAVKDEDTDTYTFKLKRLPKVSLKGGRLPR
jgi:hypothetical protein